MGKLRPRGVGVGAGKEDGVAGEMGRGVRELWRWV